MTTVLIVLAGLYGVTWLFAFGAMLGAETMESRATFGMVIRCAVVALVWPVIALLLARK